MNKRELATVLHSLRQTQREIQNGAKLDEALHFGPEGIKPLTVLEISDLCERLNTEKTPTILIEVEGGLVADLTSDLPITAVIVDRDVEGADEEDIRQFPGPGENSTEVTTTRWSADEITVSPKFVEAALKSLKLED
jgi:hypothetical protein